MATKKGAPKPARSTSGKSSKAAVPAKKAASRPAQANGSKAAASKTGKSVATKTPAKKAVEKKAAPKKESPKKAPAPAKATRTTGEAAKNVHASKTAKSAVKTAAPAKKEPAASKVSPVKKESAPVKEAPAKNEGSVKKPVVAADTKEEVKPAIKPLEKPTGKKETPKPVVIPKTSTTKAVKYEPDFTKSVLDTHQQNQESQGPTMRYSDAELVEFRELINRKLDTAKKELAYLQGLITRKDESGDLDEGRYMTMEDGSMSMEREQLSQMASRQIQFIDHLEKAIMRIENKTYGICRVTGKLIDKARLRAVPHATLSIEAKQMMNK